jgi:serine/threonine protein kinase/Tol biopolymer transport system component
MAEQLVGQQFGGYEILEEIGRGGMAVVYKARQVSMDRLVAVKVLPRQFVHDQTFRARFEREVSIVAKLEHRAIVPVHDYGEQDELPYIVMRYMDSGSVDDLLMYGPMEPSRAEQIITQIASGLDFAHTRGVLHRDLKPSNILLDNAGDAYLTDFGIASLSGGSKITTEGVVGTPAYMSPEQAQGLKLDGRSDVYGLAVLAFEMFTARRPYESDTPYGIAVMHVTAPVPSACEAYPPLSPAIDRVLQRGLSKNRAERYQTCAAFAEAIAKAIQTSPEEAAASAASTKPIDLQEAHQQIELPEQIHVSAPVRPGASVRVGTDPARDQPAQPTPRSSLRVNRVASAAPSGGSRPLDPAVPRPRPRRSRPLWVNALIGVVIGAVFFMLVAGVLLVVSLLNTQEPEPVPTVTYTPTISGADVTVIAPLGPMHPAAVVLTQTAEAIPTVNPMESLSVNGGRIVFYAARNDEDAELYLLDLSTGLEQQITDNDAEDIYPAVSPDGSQIAFMSDRDGDFEIYVIPLDCMAADNGPADCESSAQRLTRNEIEDRTPAWSPDGSQVFYSSDTDFNGRYDIYRINADGSAMTQLTDSLTYDEHPSMSPDSRYIVYYAREIDDPETGVIMRYDVQTGVTVTLADSAGNDWSPTYSPDGRWIAFHRRGDGDAGLWLMDASGRNLTEIYDGPGYDWASTWIADGQLIAFTSDLSGIQEIYITAPSGGEVRKITTGGGEYPSWVP